MRRISHEKSYPFPLMSKGERNMRRIGHMWRMDVSINAKGGYYWKVSFH
jgi:hypothetical protein